MRWPALLAAALAAGKLFLAPFNFRDDYQRQTMALVGNEHGTVAP